MKIRSSSPVVDKSFLKSLYFKTVSKLSKLWTNKLSLFK
jgi:hypothetical protein